MTTEKLFDVVEVKVKTGKVSAFMGEGKTERNAEAIVKMCILRRGLNGVVYAEIESGSKKVGDLLHA